MSANPRILIVDDEKIVCDMCRISFTRSGYDVTTFTDSKQARAALETETFDVMITDLKMKGVDGIELLEFAKEMNPDTQVILLTAFGTMETAVDAFRKQAFDYFTKPARISDLQESVRRALVREGEE